MLEPPPGLHEAFASSLSRVALVVRKQNEDECIQILSQEKLTQSCQEGVELAYTMHRGIATFAFVAPKQVRFRVRDFARKPWILRHSSSFSVTPPSDIPVIDKETLKTRMKQDSVVVVDVREPEEVRETGDLTHGGNVAINVPLGIILQDPSILELEKEEFFLEFGDELPARDDMEKSIVFSCRSGVRSEHACIKARQLGFANVLNFKGSALEWFK